MQLGQNKTEANLHILNRRIKTAIQSLFRETHGTFRWNPFHFILNGFKDMVCWKMYNFLRNPVDYMGVCPYGNSGI